MDDALASLIAASVTFLGTHFALSHPLRAPLVKALGAGGFMALYSAVALAGFGWMVFAFWMIGMGGTPLWNGGSEAIWVLASVLTLLAAVLFSGSFEGNPALPDPRAAALAAKGPHGVFNITRHPMMWGFALWAMAHSLISPTPRVLVLAGTLGFLALVGAHLQDAKKEVLMGAAWGQWKAKTSYWPRFSRLPQAGTMAWLIGIATWLAATWAHLWLATIPAGVWRWVG
jgi:uncharacterized membrane protein